MRISKAIFYLSIRCTLAAVFAVSGFTKLMEPNSVVVSSVEAYKIISGPLAQIVAYAIPWAEWIAGIFLFFGLWTQITLFMLWAMNTLFIGVISLSLVRGISLKDCGCFGESSGVSMPLWQILCLDITLSVMFLGYFLYRKKNKAIVFEFDTII